MKSNLRRGVIYIGARDAFVHPFNFRFVLQVTGLERYICIKETARVYLYYLQWRLPQKRFAGYRKRKKKRIVRKSFVRTVSIVA